MQILLKGAQVQRRQFLEILGASALGAVVPTKVVASTRVPKSDPRPNILIIMADQHNPHVLGCYGDPIVKTPHLDALAASGVLFKNTYCQAPLCVPSRMSFLTARYPYQNRIWTNAGALPSQVCTFPYVLGAGGYETALIGRMHFLGLDQWHGFERRLVGSITPMLPNGHWPLPPKLLIGAEGNSRAALDTAGPGKTAYQVYDEQVTDAAVQYLHQKATNNDRPFCAVVGYVLPHPPYICPKDLWLYYRDRVTVPPVPAGYFEHLHPAIRQWRKASGLVDLTSEEIRKARAGYYGLVTYHDSMIGRVLRSLEETPDLRRNTIIIYTSDHGDMAGENGMFWKSNLYQGSVTVPLIVACPDRFKAGQQRDEIVSLFDVGPTVVELGQAGPWPNAVGKSFAPLLSGRSTNWVNEAFSEFPQSSSGVPTARMIRSGKWKLVYFEGMRPQLFDLEADPHEFHDLGENPEYEQIRAKLVDKVLQGWSAEQVDAEIAYQQRDQKIIERWYERVNPPPPPEQWIAPTHSNIFPSENRE